MKPLSIFFIALTLLIGTAAAKEFKVAVVDLAVVFKAHPETAQAEQEMEGKRREARDAFVAKKKEMEEVLSDHREVTQQLVAAGTGASESLKERAQSLLDQASALEKELATMQTTQANDLKSGFIEERRRILGLIRQKIEEFNQDGRYALILDKSASSANGLPQILHAPGAENVTEEIQALFR